MRRLAVVIASAGGVGYAPFAPGTFGSLVGLGIYFVTRHWNAGGQVALVVGVAVIGTWASTEAARHFDREDPGHVVVDEVAGQLLTLLLTGAGIVAALAGFIVFRVLDIVKPWPANRLESLPGGMGIMADDLMAGLYGLVLMHALVRLLPEGW